jgi:outer membrane receptor protein involved in Fe transport
MASTGVASGQVGGVTVRFVLGGALAAALAAVLATPVLGEETSSTAVQPPVTEETIEVTATRLPEDILDVPTSVTIITGEELAARGVHYLEGALALVGGVSIAPGGDGGPASSVPEMMGLREFDAFLLVVDGVPWGGAFNPALATLDLTNVDRIEVVRGAAPVLYGATSFVGVIQVIHRTPQDTPREVGAWAGNYDSYSGAITSALPDAEKFSNSISASYEDVGFSDDRTGFERAHALWSASIGIGEGALQLMVDATAVDQLPASPHPREGAELSPIVPIDANFNPSDAGIEEDRYHVVIGYAHPAGAGDWTSTLALSHTSRDTVRGFLLEDFSTLPPGQPNAVGYSQDFSGDDMYLDSHWSWSPKAELSLVTGVDVLSGKGEAVSHIFQYFMPPDGSGVPPPSDTLPIVESPEFEDERTFVGAYGLVLWSPGPRWRVDAGLRLNVTREKQEGEVEQIGGEVQVSDELTETRPSGKIGTSFRAWQGQQSVLWVFGGYTNAFKPAAVDFGPEAEGNLLDPETAATYEAGIKGEHLAGRLFWQAWLYHMDFDNLVIAQTVNGLPSLINGGTQTFDGFEVEGQWRVRPSLDVRASFAEHSSEFDDFVQEFDGIPVQLAGNKLEMVPDELASVGATWYPEHGVLGWGGINYVGDRYLNKRNTALADSYTAFFAGVGYRFDAVDIRLDGENLTDERDPVSESELGEAQYYLLPARRYRFTLVWRI